MDETSGTGAGYDRLYFDLNRDLDLANDTPRRPQKDPPPGARLSWSWIKQQVCFETVNVSFDAGDSGAVMRTIMPRLALSEDETRLLILDPSDLSLWLRELTSGVRRELAAHRGAGSALFADAKGEVVISTDPEGAIRVGRIDDEEPHLLIASEPSTLLDVSPDGGWIAATSGDDVYLWPMPDLDEPPIHTLPRTELLARLRALVNLEAVPDPESVSGWALEIGPFPGWEVVPTW